MCIVTSNRILWSSVVVLILACQASAAEQYVVASCAEVSVPQGPCIIERLDIENGECRQELSIPLIGGVWRIEGYPHQRKLILWAEQKGEKNAYVIALDMDDLSSLTMDLPFSAISKGMLLDHPEHGMSLVGIGLDNESLPFLHSLTDGTSKREKSEEIPWENVLLLGSSKRRAWNSFAFPYMIMKDSGKMINHIEKHKYPINVSLDEESRALMRASSADWFAGLRCIDKNQMVFFVRGGGERNKSHQCFTFDKGTGKWRHFETKENDSSIQMFDEWLIVQEARTLKPHTEAPPTGEFGFHQRDGKGHFYWKATPDTEVLAIEGSRLFYRQGCQLMTADIEANRIINERVLFKSDDPKIQKILEQVHWLFAMNAPKQP